MKHLPIAVGVAILGAMLGLIVGPMIGASFQGALLVGASAGAVYLVVALGAWANRRRGPAETPPG